MKHSQYQIDIFEHICKKSAKSLVIEAVAGSGKTSTLVWALEKIPSSSKVVFLAFNKSIAEELAERAPGHVECMTTHSLGNRIVRANMGHKRLDANKTWNILKSMDLDEGWIKTNGYTVTRIVSLMKATAMIPQGMSNPNSLPVATIDSTRKLILDYDLDVDASKASLFDTLCTTSMEVLSKSIQDQGAIDFDDMIYLPVISGKSLKVPKYDYVFVDEAQDLSNVQMCFLNLLKGSKTKIVAVGDSGQAIYRFRGAGSNSMQDLRETFGADSLPLSVTYRCPLSVVKEAQKIVPTIEAAPGAQEGEVKQAQEMSLSSFKAGDMIVSRTTAPTIALAYRLISQGIKAQVIGRDIGKGLTGLIKKLKPKDTADLIEKLGDWKEKEISARLKVHPEADVTSIEDRYECLMTFVTNGKTYTIPGLCTEIETFFADYETAGSVRLSTVHKAKGLEANTVYILDYHKMPSRWAKRPEAIKQENNIKYVAITRAKETLVFVKLEDIKD